MLKKKKQRWKRRFIVLVFSLSIFALLAFSPLLHGEIMQRAAFTFGSIPTELQESKWVLSEVHGRSVIDDFTKRPTLYFERSVFFGFTDGCNAGSFEDRFIMYQTAMACYIDTAPVHWLSWVTWYQVDRDSLKLYTPVSFIRPILTYHRAPVTP